MVLTLSQGQQRLGGQQTAEHLQQRQVINKQWPMTVHCSVNITTNRFTWSNVPSQLKFINYHQKYFYTLTFRLLLEVFIRRMKTFLHPVLGTVSNRCAKKTIVQCIVFLAHLLLTELLSQEPDEEMFSFFW